MLLSAWSQSLRGNLDGPLPVLIPAQRDVRAAQQYVVDVVVIANLAPAALDRDDAALEDVVVVEPAIRNQELGDALL